MGKRKHKENNEEEIRKKIRRLERRLERRRKERDSDELVEDDYGSEYSSSSNQRMRSEISFPSHANNSDLNLSSQVNEEEIITTQEPSIVPLPELCPESNGNTELPTLSSELLDALGVSKHKVESFAPMIRDEISERWGKIIVDGLSKESIQKLMEDILIPENFKLLKAPELNPEIAAVLTDSSKNRDKRLEKAQNHLGKGIAAITHLLCTLIDKEVDKTYIIKKLSEIGQLFLDLHCQNTFTRRKLITYSLDKRFLSVIQGVKRDSLLFGENLGDKIKAKKAAEHTGIQIKRVNDPQPSTSYRPSQGATRQGNWRGPPRSQTQRGRRGGPRNQIPSQAARRLPTTNDRNNLSTKASYNKQTYRI